MQEKFAQLVHSSDVGDVKKGGDIGRGLHLDRDGGQTLWGGAGVQGATAPTRWGAGLAAAHFRDEVFL